MVASGTREPEPDSNQTGQTIHLSCLNPTNQGQTSKLGRCDGVLSATGQMSRHCV